MKSFIQGLLFGGLVGGAIALLNSPSDGKGNRELFEQKIRRTNDDVQDLTASLGDLGRSTSKLTKQIPVLTDSVKGIQRSVSSFQLEAEPRINRIQESVEQLNKDVEQVEITFNKNPENRIID